VRERERDKGKHKRHDDCAGRRVKRGSHLGGEAVLGLAARVERFALRQRHDRAVRVGTVAAERERRTVLEEGGRGGGANVIGIRVQFVV
jgi:hypothetical protein